MKALNIKGRWKNFTRQEKIILPIVHFLIFILSLWAILPMVFVLINSFKDVQQYNDSILTLPKVWIFSNYSDAFRLTYRNTSILGMFLNSIIFTLTYSVANVFASCMSAYVLSKYNFKLKKYIYSLAIIVQILPVFGTGGAAYLLCAKLGILDNIGLMWITACSGFDYTFLIVYSYFKNVSWDYAEAAFIDGASNGYVFIKIMMPMVMPAVLTMWLSNVIGLWNDYMTPLVYLQHSPTLATGLYNLNSQAYFLKGGVTIYFAALIIAAIPIILLYICLQKRIFSIKIEGGLKG